MSTIYNCNYCLEYVHTKHKEKCFLHENNIIYIKKYLTHCFLNLERPSCQHMTLWLSNFPIVKPRTLLNISNFESFDDLLYYYIEQIIKISSNKEIEIFLIVKNWLSIDKPIDIDYNEKLYDQENLFDKRVAFIKEIISEEI